jgi:predicted heme/steroid binding protein
MFAAGITRVQLLQTDRGGFTMKTTAFRILLVALLALTVILALSACAPKTAAPTAVPEATAAATEAPVATQAPAATDTPAATAVPVATATAKAELPVFTAETLAKYDGKNGNPAYIAIDGMVYDVSKVPQWANGIHAGTHVAGIDQTEALKSAPHGSGKLNGVPIVGTYQTTVSGN